MMNEKEKLNIFQVDALVMLRNAALLRFKYFSVNSLVLLPTLWENLLIRHIFTAPHWLRRLHRRSKTKENQSDYEPLNLENVKLSFSLFKTPYVETMYPELLQLNRQGRIPVWWQTLQHIGLPYTWPPKITFFKFSAKVRCCLFITSSSPRASSCLSKFRRPDVPRPRVPAFPCPWVPAPPCPGVPKSQVPRPCPTFSHSPLIAGFVQQDGFNRGVCWKRVTQKHWPPVCGPPLQTGSADYLRTGPRTTPTDPLTDHPQNSIKNKNKDFT